MTEIQEPQPRLSPEQSSAAQGPLAFAASPSLGFWLYVNQPTANWQTSFPFRKATPAETNPDMNPSAGLTLKPLFWWCWQRHPAEFSYCEVVNIALFKFANHLFLFLFLKSVLRIIRTFKKMLPLPHSRRGNFFWRYSRILEVGRMGSKQYFLPPLSSTLTIFSRPEY